MVRKSVKSNIMYLIMLHTCPNIVNIHQSAAGLVHSYVTTSPFPTFWREMQHAQLSSYINSGYLDYYT